VTPEPVEQASVTPRPAPVDQVPVAEPAFEGSVPPQTAPYAEPYAEPLAVGAAAGGAVAAATWPAASPDAEETPAVAAAEAPLVPPAGPVQGALAAADAPAEPEAPTRPPRLAALSDIISTTNRQQVDLNDPEVRRMLKELVRNEIDLAEQYKQLGQNVDAVLQLTEAQKICQALDMASHAKLIGQMIRELQG